VRNRRIAADTPADAEDVLARLGLVRDGAVLQAAQVLYGTRFLGDYPQCLLKLGRFRGTKITGDIIDDKQEHMHAFAMVREAMAFLDRTLPLSGHFEEGRIEREDRLAVPPDALREVLLNAVMHRDYSNPAGHVAVAVFDDRVEIRSIGGLPAGITAEMLSGPHPSKPRNPLIAETFHRTGAVEVWGRGTNRVIDECRRYGLAEPTFEDRDGTVVVTFKAKIGPAAGPAPSRDQVGTKSGLSGDQVTVLVEALKEPQALKDLMSKCGRTNRTKFRDGVLRPLLDDGLLEMTIPDKPTSRLQKYRTTAAAREAAEGGEDT
jgi:ATP-dependent DNA helicase RecG